MYTCRGTQKLWLSFFCQCCCVFYHYLYRALFLLPPPPPPPPLYRTQKAKQKCIYFSKHDKINHTSLGYIIF